ALEQFRAGHQPLEVVRNLFLADGLFQAANDAVGDFLPSQMLEHQDPRQDNRTGVDLVLVGVLGRGAVGRLEDRVTGQIVDIRTGSDSDAADLRRERVGQIVAVKVHRGDDVEFVGTGQHLLKGNVGDRVLDQQFTGGRLAVAIVPSYRLALVFTADQLVAPIAERALRVLHDVALVDQGHALALVANRVIERGANQALGALARDGLDADSRGLGETDFRDAHFVLQKFDEFLCLGRLRRPFDSRVDVLGVLAKDHNVEFLGMLDGTRHAREVAHRAQAYVEVEHLAQRDVERADAAADWSRQGTLDADQEFAERFDGFVGQPAVPILERLLAREHFHPRDLALATVNFLHRVVENVLRRAPDVGAGAVAFDKRDDRAVGNVQGMIGAKGNLFAVAGNLDMLVCHRCRNSPLVRMIERRRGARFDLFTTSRGAQSIRLSYSKGFAM